MSKQMTNKCEQTLGYEHLVAELRAELGVQDATKQADQGFDRLQNDQLQKKVLSATRNLVQQVPSDIKSRPTKPKFLAGLFTLKTASIIAPCVALVVITANLISVNKPAPTTIAVVDYRAEQEADLTFEELWLEEDQLLFSGNVTPLQ